MEILETEVKQVVIDDTDPEQVAQKCGDHKCHANAYCDSSLGHVSSSNSP